MREEAVIATSGPTAGDYRRLLARDPNPIRFAECADELRRAGLFAEARDLCQEGLSRNPDYPTGHVVMGEVCVAAGMIEEAEFSFRRALRLDPRHPRAHLRLGECQLRRGNTAAAELAFETALLYGPGDPEVQARVTSSQPSPPEARPTESSRRADTRPAWLTEERVDDFDSSLAGMTVVADVSIIVGHDRTNLRNSVEMTTEDTLAFIEGGRNLLARLGAGRFRSALVTGVSRWIRCIPLADIVMLVRLPEGISDDGADWSLEVFLTDGTVKEEANESPLARCETAILDDIAAVRSLPGVTAALLATKDGLLLAGANSSGWDEEALAAAAAVIGGCAPRVAGQPAEFIVLDGTRLRLLVRPVPPGYLLITTAPESPVDPILQTLREAADHCGDRYQALLPTP